MSTIKKLEKAAIIMAGGSGARLWPRSGEKMPKQFIHLLGDGTMIQNSVMRLLPYFAPEENIHHNFATLHTVFEGPITADSD
jgi:mannose-1-phosphate guanylyltransferase